MIKYSVVIPVYNAASTIRRCVESIMHNTFKDIEVILVEDGSSDNSWEVCNQLAKDFKNIVIVKNEENKGVSYTRNRGLKFVQGEYTMFADSDDWVEESYYAEFNQVIEKYHPSFVVCGYVNHDEKQSGRIDNFCWDDFQGVKKTSVKPILENLYDKCLLQQLWNKAFLTSVIQENALHFDESINIGEDFRFVLDYLKTGKVDSCTLINKTLYHYMRDQSGSLMFNVGYESVEEPLENKRRLYEIIGLNEEEIEKEIKSERIKQIELYAYLIMHNVGMKWSEKKRLIFALDSEKGKSLYKKNHLLYWKEKINKWFHKL